MEPSLHIFDERGSRSFRVWPQPEEIPSGVIQEARLYKFELRDAPDATTADLFVDDVPLEALRSQDPLIAHWWWSPGFHVGTVEAALQMSGLNTQRFEIITDPDVRKLTRDDFDAMVREILEDTFALFSLTSFRKGISRGAGNRPPPIARLEFLRSRIDEIDKTVREIAKSPRRILRSEHYTVPRHRALHATGWEILRSFRNGRIDRETRRRPQLPEPLRGYLPAKITVRKRRDSLDIREHRELKACLNAWAGWLSHVSNLLSGIAPSVDHDLRKSTTVWHRRSRQMARQLRELSALSVFRDVGDGSPKLLLSPIWRNDPTYRRFFQLHRDMSLGIAALFGDFLQMPLARSFELYELWCFLRLARAAAELFGPDRLDLKNLFINDATGGVTLAAGTVVISVDDTLTLCFQRSFREFWNEADQRGSFSRTMTPDVALFTGTKDDESKPLIILDAKYRINDGLSAALSSIHTYRDALVTEAETGEIRGVVRAAYLLTPHVPELVESYRRTALPGRLFHPNYRSAFQFGAVTLRPGMNSEALASTLSLILEDAATNK